MRAAPNLRIKDYIQPNQGNGLMYPNSNDGWALIPHGGVVLKVIFSDGMGWDHVSVSGRYRCPTWQEMDFVRELFFRDDETVMQLSVPRSKHINVHDFCLHLWRPQHAEIPLPEPAMV